MPGCPLALTSARVAPAAKLVPVTMRNDGGEALALHFRNRSGREFLAADITARLRVKTDAYALDATPVELHLTFFGTDEMGIDHVATIPLPNHMYLFGTAQVSLDRVTFASGRTWSAPHRAACTTNDLRPLEIDAW